MKKSAWQQRGLTDIHLQQRIQKFVPVSYKRLNSIGGCVFSNGLNITICDGKNEKLRNFFFKLENTHQIGYQCCFWKKNYIEWPLKGPKVKN